MKKIAKSLIGALLIVSAMLLTLSALQLNWSMITTELIKLTFYIHVLQIITVALVMVFNTNAPVDYAACITLLISGVKPANALVNRYLGKIDGIIGAVVPVLLLIAIVLLIVALFYMAYKTNKIAIGKSLVVIISCLSVLASIVVGFLINALAETNGVSQIGFVAESLMAAVATFFMIISFFLTKEDRAKVAIVVAGLLTWWPIINETLMNLVVQKLISIKSYTLKGLIPIVMGMLAIELLRSGLILLFDKPSIQEESEENEESSPEE
jgi:hypothetical protein